MSRVKVPELVLPGTLHFSSQLSTTGPRQYIYILE